MSETDKIKRFEAPSRVATRTPSILPAAYEAVETEKAIDLLVYWRVIRKRRWTIVTMVFVLFAIVLIGTLRQTPVYRASALLEIQNENPEILTFQELFKLEGVSNTYLETQYKILGSESLARRVIEQHRLDRVAEFNPSGGWFSSGDGSQASSLQVFAVEGAASQGDGGSNRGILERFRRRLSVEPVKRSRLVRVSFESQNAELAARVVNALASNYIERNLEAHWEATQKATEWLSQQLTGLKVGLEKSEDDLLNYARRQGLLFLDGEGGTTENVINVRLRQLQEELTRAQSERFAKESLYSLVQGSDYGSLPSVFGSQMLQDLTVRLADLKSERAELAATFTPDYPKVKQLQNQVEEIEGIIAQERERGARRIKAEYQAAISRELLLEQAFELAQERANVIAERSVQYNILKREVDTNKEMYEGLLQTLKQAGVSAGLRATNVRIVDPAEPPGRPVRPNLTLNLALALFLGLGLGVGTVFLQEYMDNTLKSSEDVERYLHVPALALIPSVASLNGHQGRVQDLFRRGGNKLLAGVARDSDLEESEVGSPIPATWHRIDIEGQEHTSLAEAFRSLRTSVLLSTAERPPRSLLVTSSQPGEGKTTVSTNLCISMAQLGRRVLLIDGDMRRPSVHKMLQIKDYSNGLVSYLTGSLAWQEAIRQSGIPGIDVLICGPIPPNPAELLSSERAQRLIQEAVQDYDIVVVDSPPILSVTDSRILATLVEGTVLVVRGGGTPREVVQRSQSYALGVGAHIIGVVLNNLDTRDNDYYDSHYGYSYRGHGEEGSDQALSGGR